MISGFNTDVEYDGVVYHVQTEDKGLSTRKIISLVYDGGTILASKRTPYDDLANGNFDEEILAGRVQKQHKLICAAIRAGRIAELKKMSAKKPIVPPAFPSEIVGEAAIRLASAPPAGIAAVTPDGDVNGNSVTVPYSPFEAVPKPSFDGPEFAASFVELTDDIFADSPIIDGVSIIEDDDMLPAEAVAIVSELSGRERPANFKLGVELLGDAKFRGGDRLTVNIMVCRGTDRKVVADAQIMIKVLGSSFRPVIFHAISDTNGLARVHMQFPHFQAGRAALLIRAMDHGEEIELRRIVTPG